MKFYVPIENPNSDANYYKIEVYYHLGGINYFTYKTEPRGYYLSITPVYKENRGGYNMESYTAFTGIKKCIKTVTRKSIKAEAEAEKTARELLPDFLEYMERHTGYKINPEEVQI